MRLSRSRPSRSCWSFVVNYPILTSSSFPLCSFPFILSKLPLLKVNEVIPIQESFSTPSNPFLDSRDSPPESLYEKKIPFADRFEDAVVAAVPLVSCCCCWVPAVLLLVCCWAAAALIAEISCPAIIEDNTIFASEVCLIQSKYVDLCAIRSNVQYVVVR